MMFLEVSQISKQQGNGTVVNNVSFTQHQFQKVAIAGETGSGKSTLLKMIGGLVQPDEGRIVFNGKRVEGPLERLLPGHPEIAYLSQHFELRNNYRVEEELDYLNQLGDEEAHALFRICRIDHLLKRKTTEVSGGEKQRISLARLLLSSPRLLLLDEPFSNLDYIHKNLLKKVIHEVGERLGITCMLVSHEPADTLSWADEMLVMKDGRIVQQGTPEEIYHTPANEYVAALSGHYNSLSLSLYAAFSQAPLEQGLPSPFFRPEQFAVNALHTKFVKGKVQNSRFLGSAYELDVEFDAGERVIVRTHLSNLRRGDIVRVSLLPAGW